jgi:hypothetical protein
MSADKNEGQNALTTRLRELTLRAIADDYEDFERIVQDVTAWADDLGISVPRYQTMKALEELIERGHAQAFLLSSAPPGKAEVVNYSRARLGELWFYVTPKGLQLAKDLQKKWG